ncbi:hypothetical protein, partial [Luteococcus sp.]|uniref:hypothetical protein n=1 Tax=Luteococcus sp. TaxID=1969402 RepID=UPI003735F861
SNVSDVPAKGRDTMGVKFVGVRGDDEVAVIALNPEAADEELAEESDLTAESASAGGTAAATVGEQDSTQMVTDEQEESGE